MDLKHVLKSKKFTNRNLETKKTFAMKVIFYPDDLVYNV